jgi:hypothetical protein
MIKNFKNFINENKSDKKNQNFLRTDEYKKFIEEEFSDLRLDLEDSLIDVSDFCEIRTKPYISDENGKVDPDGNKLGYTISIDVPLKDEYSIEEWYNTLELYKSINNIVKETISRFSKNIESKILNMSESENKFLISLKFISDNLDLVKYNDIYDEWSNNFLKHEKLVQDILYYLDNKTYGMIGFDFDYEYEKSGNNIEIYLTDTAYRLGVIAKYRLGDKIEDIEIYYDAIEEINDEYLEGLDEYR